MAAHQPTSACAFCYPELLQNRSTGSAATRGLDVRRVSRGVRGIHLLRRTSIARVRGTGAAEVIPRSVVLIRPLHAARHLAGAEELSRRLKRLLSRERLDGRKLQIDAAAALEHLLGIRVAGVLGV